jgi:hypothetical protein
MVLRVARYVRLYADAAGESHFAEVAVPLVAADFAPPARPMNLSAFVPATRWAFFEIPAGWIGDWHPTPRRQVFFWLAGEVEITASDGAVRRFPAGTVLLVEDTTGKGHHSRTVAADTLAAVVQLPD